MRPVYPAARVAGSAVAVLCGPGDNLMIHAAIAVVQPGDVLVVTTSSKSAAGMFGELLAESCHAQGVAGLVIEARRSRTATRLAGKCVARETLSLLKRTIAADVFQKIVWVNIHELLRLSGRAGVVDPA